MVEIKNYIGGEWCKASSQIDNWNPAVGEVYSQVADSDPRDLDQAVEAAQRAFGQWSETGIADRARFLRRIAEGIEKRKNELSQAECVDTGKPITLAASIDIPRSVLNFHFFADAITQFSGESHMTDNVALNYTLRNPLGAVGCIAPWNLPLYLLTWKIAPALAAGNTVVAKPSEVTPMTAYLLSEICHEVGLPPGVLNIVHGRGSIAGAALVAHDKIKAVSFTGSTKTGAEIARVVGPRFKKQSLEMGGKNPTIVFADCDLEETLTQTVRSAFANQGQVCLCGSRILVEHTLYEKFRDEFIRRTKLLKLGDPTEKSTDQGALVSRPHMEKVLSYIDLARQEGGRILTGGKRAQIGGRCQNGWFVEPTLIEGLKNECRTNQEEIFGPVATLMPFRSEQEAIALANSSSYGLAASIWTKDLKRAHQTASRIQCGIVWINCWMLRDLRTPFGGMKDSGVGREGGIEALRFFTEPKNICVKL